MPERLDIVTIDGPSGVGKSTVSRKLAARLGYTYLDTGAMYRAVALKCKMANIIVQDESAVAAMLENFDLQLLPAASEHDDVRVFLDGEEVSELIRTEEISMLASAVSALPAVRKSLTALQQKYGNSGRVVAEGRDTGTVVFPSAAWKFFLDAAPEERARRRIHQLRSRGKEVNEEEILSRIIQRDRDDSERSLAPLKAASEAVLLDTTRLTPEEVIERMLASIRGE
ncbi:MAG: (d)CMP kinase [Desulfobulbaceae bacterium]|nr:(d)CMP kinase [Desulfobulbaceae bacterium]